MYLATIISICDQTIFFGGANTNSIITLFIVDSQKISGFSTGSTQSFSSAVQRWRAKLPLSCQWSFLPRSMLEKEFWNLTCPLVKMSLNSFHSGMSRSWLCPSTALNTFTRSITNHSHFFFTLVTGVWFLLLYINWSLHSSSHWNSQELKHKNECSSFIQIHQEAKCTK